MSELGAPLPRGWKWAKLGEIASISGGITKGQKFKPGTGTRHVPYLRVANVQRGYLDLDEIKSIEATEDDIATLRLQSGDILFNEGGDRDKLGRGWIWEGQLPECIHQNHVFRARPYVPDLNPKFISLWGNTFGQAWFMKVGKQSVNLASINMSNLRAFPVPIAPAGEQARIVEEVDEILSDLDAGDAALEQVQLKLAHYRSAVLKAAVEGALTAEWRRQHPATEPASALLTRILAERRRRWEEEQLRKLAPAGRGQPKNWRARYKDPVPPDVVDLPPIPDGWALASMDALTCRITSGSRDWQQHYGKGSGTFVMAQNVRPGYLDLTSQQAVNPPAEDPSCERSRVECNDLLVTIVGANTGDVCRVPDSLPEHYVCQSVALMRPAEAATAKFLSVYYNSPSGGQLHYRRYIYGAGRPHLSFDQLKMTPVLLPPLNEQEAIVEAVEDQLSVIDHIEADLETKLKTAQALRQSILRHAFTGQLVPQDPNDEPASELLKRIAAERAERQALVRAEKHPNLARRRPRKVTSAHVQPPRD